MPNVGDIAPDFELEGTDGTFTPVCTKQFCSYAERADDFDSLDATVVGISAQPVERHNEFKAMHAIPVSLLADVDRSVAKSYKLSQPVLGTRRAVVIVDEDGRIAYKHVHRLGLDFQTVDELAEALAGVPARA
jgi:peroxiredoxin Q/BCP